MQHVTTQGMRAVTVFLPFLSRRILISVNVWQHGCDENFVVHVFLIKTLDENDILHSHHILDIILHPNVGKKAKR